MFFFKEKKKSKNECEELKAFISGKAISITDVKDDVFSAKMLGDGLAIIPENDEVIVSPSEGEVTFLAEDTRHAIGISLNNGVEILIHVGLDTLKMKGEGFVYHVKEGDKVKTGDKLMNFDKHLIEKNGLDPVCILVVTNSDEHKISKYCVNQNVKSGESSIMFF